MPTMNSPTSSNDNEPENSEHPANSAIDISEEEPAAGSTIQDDIQALINGLTPEQVRRWVDTGPEAAKARKKTAEVNRKRREAAAKKREAKAAAKAASEAKRKTMMEADGSDEDDIDENPTKMAKLGQKVTVYVHIDPPVPSSQQPRAKMATKAPPPKPIIKGPFFYTLGLVDFPSFHNLLAKTIPCKVKHIHINRMQWRYEKPTNDTKKPLTTEAGYQAMTMSLEERKKDFVVFMSMPVPTEDSDTWDTGEDDHVTKPFDYYEETAFDKSGDRDMSAKGQIASIVANSADHIEQLRQKYPIGNCILYPDLRVYSRGTPGNLTHWELTALRLQIWSSALSQGKDGVTLERPPHSAHFDVSQQIKRRPAPVDAQAEAIPPGTQLPHPPPPQYGQPWGHNYGGYAPGYGHQPHPNYNGQPGYPPYPFAGHHQFYGHLPPGPPFYNGLAVPPGPNNPPIPSPGDALRLKVPLEVFCARYNVSESDQEKLAAMEYKPGNKAVERLTREDWAAVNFSALGWQFFLDAHKQFIHDVRNGTWAMT